MEAAETQKRLQELHACLMSLKFPDNALRTILPYELLPLIKSSPTLRKEYETRVRQYYEDDIDKIGSADAKTKKIWKEKCIWAFGDVDSFCESRDRQMRVTRIERESRDSFVVFMESVHAVCYELMKILENEARKDISHVKRYGRPPQAKYESGHIHWNMKICVIERNSYMAELCGEMLSLHVKTGEEKEWQELYQSLYGKCPDSDEEWRKIDKIVRRINDAVVSEGMLPVLKYSGGKRGGVHRLL